MKLKDTYFYTIRDDIKDEETKSGNFLVKSGMIRKNSAGIYMILPLGLRILKNIENIIREEMNAINSLELLMPALVYDEVYEKSGRKEKFGDSVFKLKDRYNKSYVLGPTHEELFAVAASYKINSYKDLPFSLYQFQNKFRDEARPRFGMIRVREFIMKDAYTFDKNDEGLDKSYNAMYEAYKKIFNRMNIDYRIVKADTGVMGGILSEEFQAVTDIGEDTLVICDNCDFASNIEVAECTSKEINNNEELKPIEKINTPSVGTIKDLRDNYNIEPTNMVKSLLYMTNENNYILALIRGDRTINELKIAKLLNVNEVILATPETVKEKLDCSIGFVGPIDVKDIKIIADNEIKNMKNFLVGARIDDYHYINVNLDRDFKVNQFADIRLIDETDKCPKCDKNILFKKGIEIGNTFKLGTKYAETLDVKYTDQFNKSQPVVMGSYGIGIGRCMAAIAEQNNDENGIVWPYNIAPFKVAIVLINENDSKQSQIANYLYDELNDNGIDTVLDNRDERAGVKFNDMDLIGIPIRITVGKKATDEIVELKYRSKSEIQEINIETAIDIIRKINKEY